VVRHGVTLIGYTDLPSRLPTQASQLYGTNLRHMLTDLTPEKNGEIDVNMEDDVIRGSTVIKDGEITWPPPPPKVQAIAAPEPSPEQPPEGVEPKKKLPTSVKAAITLGAGAAFFAWLGSVAPADFMQHFTVFVLACFVGWQVVWNVTHALHTPLMSVTNAISGIIVIGALLQISNDSWVVAILAGISVLVASINVAGGFLVTQRMLKMFRKE
jgi:NAD(P) transhydrogenase subunit alpha